MKALVIAIVLGSIVTLAGRALGSELSSMQAQRTRAAQIDAAVTANR